MLCRSLLFLMALTIFSCNQSSGPEGALRSFVERRLNNTITRSDIEEIFAGDLLESYRTVDEVDFNDFADMTNYKQKKMKVLTKNCTSNICHITYVLTYGVYENDKEKFETTVKKIADLQNVDNDWKITAIKNLKTYHKADKALDINEGAK